MSSRCPHAGASHKEGLEGSVEDALTAAIGTVYSMGHCIEETGLATKRWVWLSLPLKSANV